jgi:serine/threonine protein kinase
MMFTKSHEFQSRGTSIFHSPEQILRCSPRAAEEMWSVGCTLLELSTGKNPFDIHPAEPLPQGEYKHLSLIQSFCGQKLPKEMIPCVDPKKRELFYNCVETTGVSESKGMQLEVLCHSEKTANFLGYDPMQHSQ